jgi:diguanylate cyclase (GGDEF)-like protein
VLHADGTLLGASPVSTRTRAALLPAGPGFKLAVATGRLTYGDVIVEDAVPMLYAFQPFVVSGDTRVLAVPFSVSDIGSVLRSGLGTTSGRNYVVDSAGAVVAATDNTPVGQPIPDAGLAATTQRTGQGVTGDDYYLAQPVSGSAWRVVVTAPRSSLLAPLQETNRVAWLIFAGFASAVALVFFVGAAMLISSNRLAYARLHDALTGLPSRALFLEQTERAIAQQRPVAALFLDLDGFKPVNDTYGHSAGDHLLIKVAERLRATIRPGDLVSRFGGDEFLVLCCGLADEQAIEAVAERLRQELSQPYEVDGRTVLIGVSIGTAMKNAHSDSAEKLVGNADLALYQAKRRGKGRTERFTLDLVPS